MTSAAGIVLAYAAIMRNHLDNCDEEIVTRTIEYTTSDQRTMERGTYG